MPEANRTRVLGGRTQEQSRHVYTESGANATPLEATMDSQLVWTRGKRSWTVGARDVCRSPDEPAERLSNAANAGFALQCRCPNGFRY